MTLVADATTVYAERRERARSLGARYDFAQDPLRLYLAVVDAQERTFERAQRDRPAPLDLPAYVVRVGLPGVMEASVAAGTETLREAVLLRFHDGDLEGIVEAWMRDEPLSGTDQFLARASASPVLEALPDLAATLRAAETDDRRCPRCGGLPQLAVFGDSGEALVTAQRKLVCSRCGTAWAYSRMTCVGCGENAGGSTPRERTAGAAA